jgi:hypothetical protein
MAKPKKIHWREQGYKTACGYDHNNFLSREEIESLKQIPQDMCITCHTILGGYNNNLVKEFKPPTINRCYKWYDGRRNFYRWFYLFDIKSDPYGRYIIRGAVLDKEFNPLEIKEDRLTVPNFKGWQLLNASNNINDALKQCCKFMLI